MTTATTIAFHSKPVSHRVTLIPEEWDRNHQGRIIKKYPALAVEFDNHVANLSAPELVKGMEYHEKSLEDVAEMLRAKPEYGTDFWQVGDAPGQLHPSIQERTEEIVRASVKGDRAAIEAIVAEENRTHNRPEVISYGLAAVEALEEGS